MADPQILCAAKGAESDWVAVLLAPSTLETYKKRRDVQVVEAKQTENDRQRFGKLEALAAEARMPNILSALLQAALNLGREIGKAETAAAFATANAKQAD